MVKFIIRCAGFVLLIINLLLSSYLKAEDDVILKLKENIKEHPNEEKYHLVLGQLYLNNLMYDDALQEFEAALKINNENPNAYFYLAELFYVKGEYNHAKEYLLPLLERYPEDIKVLSLLGNIYKLQDKYEEAKEIYEKFLDIGEESFAHFYLGSLYEYSGDINKAIKEYERVIELSSDNVSAYDCLVYLYDEKEMYEKEKCVLEKILELMPERKDIEEKLNELEEKMQKETESQ